MVDDFFVPLATNSGKDDDAFYLQHATFSDKARHFVMGYRLNLAFDEIFNEKFIKTIWTNPEYAPKTLGEMLEYDEGTMSRIFQECGAYKNIIERDISKNYRLRG